MNRFSRTEMLLGQEAMQHLKKATVTICGLGAVGSYVVETLARSGIGKLILVDFDIIHKSNINRQIFAVTSTLGKLKVNAATDRVHDINPECRVEQRCVFVDSQTAPNLCAEETDVLIDAIDSLTPKIELLHASLKAGIKVISIMGAATRTDPFAIKLADISDTKACPLARFVRRKLKKHGIVSGIDCIYSDELAFRTSRVSNAHSDQTEKEYYERGRTREPLGSLSCITGIFGLVAARAAIGHILKNLDIPALKKRLQLNY